jgi:uncharacterized membrane protein
MAQPNSRLEAFSDGIFAFAITLLIINVRIPESTRINSNAEFWSALKNISPSVLTFLLSFIVIFITWVNHHNYIKLLDKTSNAFIYTNGILLLSVVILPFPTSMQGEYLFTNHAAPAVILYDAALAFQALGWILVSKTAIKDQLAKNKQANQSLGKNYRFGFFAFMLYSVFSILATWFPLVIAGLTALSWIFWLIVSVRILIEE